jgi:hypothetical protein
LRQVDNYGKQTRTGWHPTSAEENKHQANRPVNILYLFAIRPEHAIWNTLEPKSLDLCMQRFSETPKKVQAYLRFRILSDAELDEWYF